MKPEISIVIPTIAGREHWLERALKSLEKRTPVEYETIIVKDRSTCGIAWNEGFNQAKGKYIVYFADDLEPVDRGWAEAGVECVESGKVPCARVLNTDGTMQSCGDTDTNELHNGAPATIARVPFLSREQAEACYPIITTHYFTDNWVSFKCAQAGWPTVVWRKLCFYHHFAPEGRIDNRLFADYKKYVRAAGVKPGILTKVGEPKPPH